MAKRSIDEALDEFRVRSELRQVSEEVRAAELRASKPSAYLPRGSSGVRLAPHVVFRTALFSAMAGTSKKSGMRQFVKDHQVAGLSNMKVCLTGRLLDQQDLDVLFAVLDVAGHAPLGTVVVVPSRRLLVSQGKADDGRSYLQLEASLVRLSSATLDIEQGEALFKGTLISTARRLSAGDVWRIRVNPDLAALFEAGGYGSVNIGVRTALQRKPLAKWLDAYYSSQPAAHPLRVETVRRLSGSKSKDLRSFKQTLGKALRAVEAARKAHGLAFTWQFDQGGLLKVRA